MNICMFSREEWGHPLEPGDYRLLHICETLRLVSGDSLKVGLSGGGRGVAILKNNPEVGQQLHLDFPPTDELIRSHFGTVELVIGHPRPPVFQRLLRDLTAAGVSRIDWIRGELSEKSYLASKAWNPDSIDSQIRLGMEQGGHTNPPAIHKHYSLHACLRDASPAQRKFLLHPPGEVTRGSLVESLAAFSGNQAGSGTDSAAPIRIAAGPERGWTDGEVAQLMDEGFVPVHLGSAILRTETAVIAAAIAAMSVAGFRSETV